MLIADGNFWRRLIKKWKGIKDRRGDIISLNRGWGEGSLFLYIGSSQIIDSDRIVMVLDAQKVSARQIFGLKEEAKTAILLEDGSFQASKISAGALNKRIERLGGK